MPNKTLDLIVNQPPVGIISHEAQMVIAVGIAAFLILLGFAKICRAIRG